MVSSLTMALASGDHVHVSADGVESAVTCLGTLYIRPLNCQHPVQRSEIEDRRFRHTRLTQQMVSLRSAMQPPPERQGS